MYGQQKGSAKEAEVALDKAHIFTNKNMIPAPSGETELTY